VENGGGVTREVATYPPGSDLGTFDWCVSIAQLLTAGPFSVFPGIDRRMAVLEGELELTIAGRAVRGISPDTPAVEFPGDVPAFATPLGGPVTDLNIMTRRGRFASRLTWDMAQQSLQLPPRMDATLILALGPLGLRCGGRRACVNRSRGSQGRGAAANGLS